MLLAADHGRNGERYIISDKYLSSHEIQTIAAEAVEADRRASGFRSS